VDFEAESSFELVIEARDSPSDPAASLASYARASVQLIDVNDNKPEITVTFMGNLFKNASAFATFKYDLYLREHAKENQFIAHVNILDRDTDQNALFAWQVLVNQRPVNETNLFKIIKLDERSSFTINVASAANLDREAHEHFNISIMSWDFGTPKLDVSFYNFTVRLLDVNDHRPVFAEAFYNVSIYENNDLFERILRLVAGDADVDAQNRNVSYYVREKSAQEYFSVDSEGWLTSKVSFDRERMDNYQFHVVAVDHGYPRLSSSVAVNLTVLDRNDHSPKISFNTSLVHSYNDNTKVSIYILFLRCFIFEFDAFLIEYT
jgi:protocadherin delta 1